MHDQSAFEAANRSILGQVGQPPPAPVLVALIETLGGEPDVVAAVVDWADGHTTWDVYGCRGDVLARVFASKDVGDWYGSSREAEGTPARIVTAAYRISTARSIGSEELVSEPSFHGFTRDCRAKWTINFDDGKLELNEFVPRYGRFVAEVAQYVRDRFLNAAPRS